MTGERPSFLDKYMPSPSPQASDEPQREALPRPGADYKPFGRRSNSDEYALHFISPGGTIRSLQYQHLDDGFYSAECIVLTFMGIRPKKVTIHGRGFRQEDYEQIHQRRTPWVRQATRDVAGDGETIVTSVTIDAIAEEREGEGKEEAAAREAAEDESGASVRAHGDSSPQTAVE